MGWGAIRSCGPIRLRLRWSRGAHTPVLAGKVRETTGTGASRLQGWDGVRSAPAVRSASASDGAGVPSPRSCLGKLKLRLNSGLKPLRSLTVESAAAETVNRLNLPVSCFFLVTFCCNRFPKLLLFDYEILSKKLAPEVRLHRLPLLAGHPILVGE